MTDASTRHSTLRQRIEKGIGVYEHEHRFTQAAVADARLALSELIEQLEAEAQYRVKAEQAIARLEEAVRVCGRHLYDCCRSDINWKLQIETHDQAVNAVAWVECDEPYPQKAQR